MYYLIMTCLTGTIWTACWYVVYAIYREKGKVMLVYYTLKVAMLGYVLPVIFLGKLIYYLISHVTMGGLWCATPFIRIVVGILAVIWLVGAVVNGIRYLGGWRSLQHIRRSQYIAGERERSILMELKKCDVKIRRPVRVCYGYAVRAPFVHGFLRPCIYLPVQKFSDHELVIVLTHELTHIKHNDELWKPFFNLLCCVFWFNPLVWKLAFYYRRWAEAYCDMICYTRHFEITEYFMGILSVLANNPESLNIFAPGWREGSREKEVVWRARMMDNYMSKRKTTKYAGIVVAGLLLISSVATFAIDTGAESLYNSLYDVTRDDSEVTQQDGGDLIEYTCDASDLEGWTILDMSDEAGASTRAADGSISNWNVPTNTMAKSGYFTKYSGDSISVVALIQPSGKTVQVGIVKPNGKMVYVQGQTTIAHTFTADSNGAYCVYIRNVSDTTITANGNYTN
jgi:beta-lactamase regulating signal transducer with metallopeptidase domain